MDKYIQKYSSKSYEVYFFIDEMHFLTKNLTQWESVFNLNNGFISINYLIYNRL